MKPTCHSDHVAANVLASVANQVGDQLEVLPSCGPDGDQRGSESLGDL